MGFMIHKLTILFSVLLGVELLWKPLIAKKVRRWTE
jgi:hypothetical protein